LLFVAAAAAFLISLGDGGFVVEKLRWLVMRNISLTDAKWRGEINGKKKAWFFW
jgi:hypothetical protein